METQVPSPPSLSSAPVSGRPPLSREDEGRLVRRARRGETPALHRLVCANIGSVVRIARAYRNKGVPLEDLVDEGIVGMIEAVGRFEPRRGIKFVTYASWWVRRSIVRALSEGACLVRVPRYRCRQFKDARMAASRLALRLGREPHSDELGRELGCGPQEAARRLEAYPRPVSLDQPPPGRDRPPSSMLPDPVGRSAEEALLRGEILARLRAALGGLPERERYVVTRRYGIGGQPVHTLSELADLMGISKERVRQIEAQARRRLARILGD